MAKALRFHLESKKIYNAFTEVFLIMQKRLDLKLASGVIIKGRKQGES